LVTLKVQLKAALEIAYLTGKLLSPGMALCVFPTLSRCEFPVLERQTRELGEPTNRSGAITGENMLNEIKHASADFVRVGTCCDILLSSDTFLSWPDRRVSSKNPGRGCLSLLRVC
jgi:hypothetical protein